MTQAPTGDAKGMIDWYKEQEKSLAEAYSFMRGLAAGATMGAANHADDFRTIARTIDAARNTIGNLAADLKKQQPS